MSCITDSINKYKLTQAVIPTRECASKLQYICDRKIHHRTHSMWKMFESWKSREVNIQPNPTAKTFVLFLYRYNKSIQRYLCLSSNKHRSSLVHSMNDSSIKYKIHAKARSSWPNNDIHSVRMVRSPSSAQITFISTALLQ